MDIRALDAPFGVEVCDFDIAATNTAEDIDQLRAAFAASKLLVFRDQELTGLQQVGFVGRFGPLCPERQLWSYVSNVRADGIVREGALLFHSDFAFAQEPTLAISLHAIDVPEAGAPTWFADASSAVERLAPLLRDTLAHASIRNIYQFGWPDDVRLREHQMRPDMPRHDHPAIGRHPTSAAPVILANQMHTDRIHGVAGDESEALLTQLFGVLYDRSNIYEHQWQVGDLVLWDNVSLHHGRPAFPADQARTMQRVALANYTAAELVPNLEVLLAK